MDKWLVRPVIVVESESGEDAERYVERLLNHQISLEDDGLLPSHLVSYEMNITLMQRRPGT